MTGDRLQRTDCDGKAWVHHKHESGKTIWIKAIADIYSLMQRENT